MSFKRNPNVNYERYPPEYFSGSNIHIFFSDIYIDEITQLQFNMQEHVMPIYGYNSYTYDTKLRGSRIIQGSFQINFKESDYIRSAVSEIMGFNEELDMNYDNEMDEHQHDEQRQNELYDIAREGWSQEFQKISEEYKKKMWKNSYAQTQNIDVDGDRPFFDFSDDFNILIKYGPYDMPRSKYRNENLFREKISSGTIIKIVDVQLQNVQQVVNNSGEPIAEQYSFLAKDMSRGVGQVAKEEPDSITLPDGSVIG